MPSPFIFKMAIKIYFIEEKKAKEILKKFKEEQELNELTINGKTYCCLECDFTYDDFKPDYIENEKCFDELKENSETNYEVYIN